MIEGSDIFCQRVFQSNFNQIIHFKEFITQLLLPSYHQTPEKYPQTRINFDVSCKHSKFKHLTEHV